MAYRFPLATLLKVRTLREENEERMLQQISAEIARTKKMQSDVMLALERLDTNQSTQAAAALKGHDFQSHYAELAGLWQTRDDLHQHLLRLEDLKSKQMNVYTAARQNREMLTDLEDSQRTAHDADQAKREQKVIDDNFASRRRPT